MNLQNAFSNVILASTSPRRKGLFTLLHIPFEVVAPPFQEQIRQEWQLSEQELAAVVRELEDHFVWNVSDGQLSLFGHSDFMAGTAILRAKVPA